MPPPGRRTWSLPSGLLLQPSGWEIWVGMTDLQRQPLLFYSGQYHHFKVTLEWLDVSLRLAPITVCSGCARSLGDLCVSCVQPSSRAAVPLEGILASPKGW